MVDDGAFEELPLPFKGDVVGALGRGQRRDDDAKDGDRDHDAKRQQHAKARSIPFGWLRPLSRA